MSTSTASVPTAHGSRYLQQLCKHWAHRFTVTVDEDRGTVDFGEGSGVSLLADAEVLTARVSSASAEGLERLERVVEDHVRRFAFREELAFAWSRTP